jgi:predicted transcriptional regulator
MVTRTVDRMKAEEILPTLRAHVAAQLVSRFGFSKKDAASSLGVTPAAVTQYLKGRRGSRLRGILEGDVLLVVEELTRKIAGGLERSAVELNLLDVAKQIISLSRGLNVRPKVEEGFDELALQLNARRMLELKTAQRCLKASDTLRDELLELLLRQIASDSLRHADIVSHILARLDRLNEPIFTTTDSATLKNVLRIEDETVDQRLDHLKECSPVVKALLNSIDLDEDKHTKILKIALGEQPPKEQT